MYLVVDYVYFSVFLFKDYMLFDKLEPIKSVFHLIYLYLSQSYTAPCCVGAVFKWAGLQVQYSLSNLALC
jgi:hypothetical protein